MAGRRFFEFGPFRLDARGPVLARGGQIVPMPPKVAAVLLTLVENAGAVVDKHELLSRAWPDTVVGEGSLTRTISLLRQLLANGSSAQEFVTTVSKRGYLFAVPVTEVVAEDSPGANKIMLAVLPFENLSGDRAQDYFSDGLTEEMLTQLARLNPERLGVIARASTMMYKSTQKTVQQIGHELGVSYVLEGSVRQAASRVRIAAQLIRVSDQTHLWAQSYDRNLTDILAVQDNVARAIAAQIQIELAPDQRARSAAPEMVHPEAYQLCLKGRYFWYKRTEDGLRKGIEYFDQAVQCDPGYAPAYDGLSDCLALLACRGFVTPHEGFPQARTAARQALKLDGQLGEAHASLAHVRMHQCEWAGLELDLQHAIDLSPSHAITYQWYAEYLRITGRAAESIAVMTTAEKLDPLSPLINCGLASSYYFARQYEAAGVQLDKALEMDPNYFLAHFRRGQICLQQGRYTEAVDSMRKAVAHSGRSAETLTGLAEVCAGAERHDDLDAVMREVHELSRSRYVSAYAIAKIHAARNDAEQVFHWLAKAVGERSADLIEVGVEPVFDSIRADRRFTALLERIGVPLAS